MSACVSVSEKKNKIFGQRKKKSRMDVAFCGAKTRHSWKQSMEMGIAKKAKIKAINRYLINRLFIE